MDKTPNLAMKIAFKAFQCRNFDLRNSLLLIGRRSK
jgi:hypothetical protein